LVITFDPALPSDKDYTKRQTAFGSASPERRAVADYVYHLYIFTLTLGALHINKLQWRVDKLLKLSTAVVADKHIDLHFTTSCKLLKNSIITRGTLHEDCKGSALQQV